MCLSIRMFQMAQIINIPLPIFLPLKNEWRCTAEITYKKFIPFMRENLAKQNIDAIPYVNLVDDVSRKA